MNYTFRWELFWKTVRVFIFTLVVAIVALQFLPLYVAPVLIICGLEYWTSRQKDESFWIGIVALTFYLVSFIFAFLVNVFSFSSPSSENSIFVILFILFPLVSSAFLYRRKLYEVAWGVILVPLSVIIFAATMIIELVIHPPSEE